MKTKRYVPRLHQDDVDAVSCSAGIREDRFVESDAELDRLVEAHSRAFRRYLDGDRTPALDLARKRAYRRTTEREAELRADWKRGGPMSSAYKRALVEYQIGDRPIAFSVEDLSGSDIEPVCSVLATDYYEAKIVLNEVRPDVTYPNYIPVRASARARARREVQP
jgi:hypothetical protein